ncbi:Mss4-like protein [Pelagophyceae sp. CCMP2097]|nr:Mss4-like protein [Pelagophyceae sp. CCMP2097]|mmetsp:Transcript_2883/g.10527  ORF Transcript_2883/g.10527 Transcript_2883/m.10527 type:complete len:210 (-) Transcript_2883:27-656(-)
MADINVDETGSCYCGRVQFRVCGAPLFNEICHCRACSRARGSSPLHLLGFDTADFSITKGVYLIKVVPCAGYLLNAPQGDALPLEHAFCRECGGFVYQQPKGCAMRALSPTTFNIEADADGRVSCALPAHLRPKAHIFYAMRLMDSHDSLPKYETTSENANGAPGVRLTNDGAPWDAAQRRTKATQCVSLAAAAAFGAACALLAARSRS